MLQAWRHDAFVPTLPGVRAACHRHACRSRASLCVPTCACMTCMAGCLTCISPAVALATSLRCSASAKAYTCLWMTSASFPIAFRASPICAIWVCCWRCLLFCSRWPPRTRGRSRPSPYLGCQTCVTYVCMYAGIYRLVIYALIYFSYIHACNMSLWFVDVSKNTKIHIV